MYTTCVEWVLRAADTTSFVPVFNSLGRQPPPVIFLEAEVCGCKGRLIQKMAIDVTFNVLSDSRGRDPDSHSPTLRQFHRELWSKPLPNGSMLELSAERPGHYLYHCSNLGQFSFSSDSIVHTYRDVKALASVIREVPTDEIESFYSLACTVAGFTIFPAKKIDGKATINGTRGFATVLTLPWNVSGDITHARIARLPTSLIDTRASFGYLKPSRDMWTFSCFGTWLQTAVQSDFSCHLTSSKRSPCRRIWRVTGYIVRL